MKRLLLIRPDGIGDFIIFSAVLEEYARLFAGYEMDLVCSPVVKQLAETTPFFSRFFCASPSKQWSLPNIRMEAHLFFSERYEMAIYPVYSRFKLGDYIAFAARAREKIVFDGDGCNDPLGARFRHNRWFTRIIESDKGQKLELARNVEFINKLGGHLDPAQARPRIWFAEEDAAQTRAIQRQHHLDASGYLAVCPAAGQRVKWWDAGQWAEVLGQFVRENPGVPVVLLGQGADQELIDSIVAHAGDTRSSLVNLCGLTPLRITAKLIESARALLAADTAAVHMAAALGTPTLCLIGGGHFGRFYPYGDLTRNRALFKQLDCFGCNWKCGNEIPYDCIRGMHPPDVWRELKSLLSTADARG